MTIPLLGTLNSLDLVLLALSLLFVVLGAWKGLIRTLFQTTAWFLGALAAYFAPEFLVPVLQRNIAGLPPFGLTLLTSILAFLATFLVVRLLGVLLDRMADKSGLGSANRWGGAIFGLVKALVLCALLLYVLDLIPAQGELAQIKAESIGVQLWHMLR